MNNPKTVIVEEISRLPAKEKEILLLLYCDDPPKTSREVASLLGLPLQWVTRFERRGLRTVSENVMRRRSLVKSIIENMRLNSGTRKIPRSP